MAHIEVSNSLRLDQYVVMHRPRISRGYAVKLIENGQVLVNGRLEKPGYKIRLNDDITIDFDESSLDIIPEIDLPIIYEDEHVIVVNKPAGVISHARGRYWDEPSVASFVRSRMTKGILPPERDGQPTRAGIVHRLDRATSGVMVCAKDSQTLSFLQKQFSERKVNKEYLAIVSGHVEPADAIIDVPLDRNPHVPATFRADGNGKPAVTKYNVVPAMHALGSMAEVDTNQSEVHSLIKQSVPHELLLLKPETGRTHQLRVHLQYIKHPIVGDVLYGGEDAERLCLHAWKLEITLPGGKRRCFYAPIPLIFAEYVP